MAPESVHVIYNSHYEPRIHDLARADAQIHIGLDEAEFTAVAVGRLTPQKGFDVLLRAMRSAVNQIDIRLIIIGAGDELERLEDLNTSLGLAGKVAFLGHADNPYPIIAGSDVFISSSRWEGLARAPIEAQALGVPVIATNIDGGVRETVLEGEAGVLVAADDPEELADAIVCLLRDETRRKKFVEVARRNIDRFSGERAAHAYLRVIDGCLLTRKF